MPQRLLRPQIRQSKRWNRLNWMSQTFYLRLLTLVDDFGRYEADSQLLRSECFPYGDPEGNDIPVQTIADMCQQMSEKGMLIIYEVDGSRYLQVTRWKERVRTDASKYPTPKESDIIVLLTNDSKCQQMIASPPQPQPQPQPSPTPQPDAGSRQHLPAAAPQPGTKAETKPKPNGKEVRVSLEKVGIPDKRTCVSVGINGNGSSPLYDLKTTVCVMYKRSETAPWSYEEERLLGEISKRTEAIEELQMLQAYRKKIPEKRYFPQSVCGLLSKWNETLDRARMANTYKSMRGE